MPESNQDASPSPSRRYFYTDPLAAAWMAKRVLAVGVKKVIAPAPGWAAGQRGSRNSHWRSVTGGEGGGKPFPLAVI